jgi:hypothetical protein
MQCAPDIGVFMGVEFAGQFEIKRILEATGFERNDRYAFGVERPEVGDRLTVNTQVSVGG